MNCIWSRSMYIVYCIVLVHSMNSMHSRIIKCNNGDYRTEKNILNSIVRTKIGIKGIKSNC